jgi:5,10-methylenetetrahydromethanopterin reductase
MVQLSIGFSGGKPLNDYITLAQMVDQYGFHTLSIFDDLLFKPAWPILTLLAHHTRRVRLGPSIANPYLIHPAILAGHIALLDELSNGRAYLGIGRGAFLEFLELEQPRPITTVREAIELIRRLLRGDPRPYQGQVFRATEGASLHWQPPRADIPIMVGTWGPRMCAMAGELADEVKAGPMWNVEFARDMWSHICQGAERVGRDPETIRLVFGPLTSISEDRQEAKALARRTLAFYMPYLNPMPEKVGVDPVEIQQINAAAGRGDYTEATRLISDLCLDSFALYGTPHDCIAQIERLVAESPVRRIEFGMPHGPDQIKAIQLLGEQVLPHFKQS